MRSTLPVTLVLTATLLSACGSNHRPDSPDMLYRSATESEMLALPPDVSGMRERQYIIPRAQGRLSRSSVLPSAEDIVLRRDGRLTWLELNLPVETLWPELVAFVGNRGLEVERNDSLTGLLTTAWARPSSREPRDGLMQKLVGDKVIVDKSRMERYVIRLERNGDGASRLFADYQIVHRDKRDERGTEGNDDSMMSSQLLKDILIWVGVSEARADGVLSAEEAASIRAGMELVSNAQGEYLLLWGDYESWFDALADIPGETLWRTEDADADSGEVEIRVSEDLMPREEPLEEPGFWAKLTGKAGQEGTPLRLRFQMVEAGVYAVDVIRSDDRIVTGEVAQKLLRHARDELLQARGLS
ncbi:outer membrane protein assembly factor BamC [Granulosicoccaceae sp. 1_MG-2023]|nr:outer membrane protein assembly factor BamC [Granulosicoccaceae sp. 1_MG-2023]